MPRYFFNVVEGTTKNITKDSEGVVLHSVREAEKEAIGFARDLVQHTEVPQTWKVVVTDENGTQIRTLPLSKFRRRSHAWPDLHRRFAALESKFGPRTFACLIAIAVIGIVAQASMRREVGTKESRYQTASSAPGATIVAVRFAPRAIAADIAKFLDAYNATLVGGPRPTGFYQLRIGEVTMSRKELAELVDRLAHEEVVEFVAAVQ
jgi:hypothetical protein